MNRSETMETMWNLWHGCHKQSEGCKNCYMFQGDAKRGRTDSETVRKTNAFTAPIQRNRQGDYKIKAGTMIWTCFTSDFFIEEADAWRQEAWAMIKERSDCNFFFITKRPERIRDNLPSDWAMGYPNVWIGVTCENQKRADERLPIFKELPIIKKSIICEPMLEKMDIAKYLDNTITQVVCGGESGVEARPCHFDWILDVNQQCKEAGVPFWFKQTGYRFVKEGKIYLIPRKFQHSQAQKAKL